MLNVGGRVPIKRLLAFLGQHVVPAGLVAGFFLVQRVGLFRWLPVAPEIERDWSPYALLLGLISAVLASGWYLEDRDYGLSSFLVTVGIAVAMALPSMVTPFARELGVTPELLSVLARVCYVGFHVANGFLFGGAWTFVLRRLEGGGSREEY